jgi:hypothetical protein
MSNERFSSLLLTCLLSATGRGRESDKMEEWEMGVSPRRREEPYESLFRLERNPDSDKCEPCWRPGDGLQVLNP